MRKLLGLTLILVGTAGWVLTRRWSYVCYILLILWGILHEIVKIRGL